MRRGHGALSAAVEWHRRDVGAFHRTRPSRGRAAAVRGGVTRPRGGGRRMRKEIKGAASQSEWKGAPGSARSRVSGAFKVH
jgi:hypothetical protein